MATKQPTQLCYQVNGGTCRNKVSAKNSYICAAGHRAIENTGTDGAAIQLPAEAVAKMDKYAQRGLAMNPMIGADVAQALFATRDKDIWSGLSTNPSIDREMAQALFDTGDHWIRHDLARNPSIDREMAIALAKDGHTPSGYLKNKSITELYSGENISLINEYPKEFGQAYLDHLLGSDEDLDQMKTLLCYSYDCYRKASGSNPKDYKELILEKYPNDEEVKILLS